ncbi:MAG TPA: hypothetical protein VFV38_11585 [Ktedonobacteraceae bacterium]|nr:hypothetical protein [Ktedonobacteraceae bacterium]
MFYPRQSSDPKKTQSPPANGRDPPAEHVTIGLVADVDIVSAYRHLPSNIPFLFGIIRLD